MNKLYRKKIYLAGGFKSEWQTEVHKSLTRFDILDPSKHNIKEPKLFTEWDLAAIRECDIVLANMESTNPGGYALALEVGYAKALNKKIIFVDQLIDPTSRLYFEMIRQCSDEVFNKLSDALAFLNKNKDD